MQKFTQKSELTINLRYLLWKDNLGVVHANWDDRLQKWSEKLAVWLKCHPTRATQLLYGMDELSYPELLALKGSTGMDDDRFMAFKNSSLYETDQSDIWQENTIFLLNKLQHGQYQELAKTLGIDKSNFSKWKQKKTRPETKYKHKLLAFFSIPSSIDLEIDPLFLNIEPFSITEQKECLKKKIDNLDSSIFTLLFPALEKLLD